MEQHAHFSPNAVGGQSSKQMMPGSLVGWGLRTQNSSIWGPFPGRIFLLKTDSNDSFERETRHHTHKVPVRCHPMFTQKSCWGWGTLPHTHEILPVLLTWDNSGTHCYESSCWGWGFTRQIQTQFGPKEIHYMRQKEAMAETTFETYITWCCNLLGAILGCFV